MNSLPWLAAAGNSPTIETLFYTAENTSGVVEKILLLLALGVDTSALQEVFGVREITMHTWWCRSGMQGKKPHDRFILELEMRNLKT